MTVEILWKFGQMCYIDKHAGKRRIVSKLASYLYMTFVISKGPYMPLVTLW